MLLEKLSHIDLQQRANDGTLSGCFRVDNDDYHAGPGISSTDLKRVLASPYHFLHAKTVAPPPGSASPALAFGTMVHEALLEPDVFEEKYALEPLELWDKPKNKNPWKQAWDAVKAEAGGRPIIEGGDMRRILGIKTMMEDSKIWQGLKRSADFEVAAYSVDSETGVLVKTKADILSVRGGPRLVVDLKTCSDVDPDAFSKSCAKFGYHLSAALYMDNFARVLGEPMDAFGWICVESAPPFGVRYFAASPTMLEVGRAQYREALRLYAQCRESRDWPCYPETFESLELPSYYMRKFE